MVNAFDEWKSKLQSLAVRAVEYVSHLEKYKLSSAVIGIVWSPLSGILERYNHNQQKQRSVVTKDQGNGKRFQQRSQKEIFVWLNEPFLCYQGGRQMTLYIFKTKKRVNFMQILRNQPGCCGIPGWNVNCDKWICSLYIHGTSTCAMGR